MPNVQRVPKKKEEGVARLRVDGEVYVLRVKDITANDSSAFRQAMKMGVNKAMTLLASDDDVDIDLVAGLVFLARRQRGERTVKFETVAADITYDSAIEAVDDDEEVDDPQL